MTDEEILAVAFAYANSHGGEEFHPYIHKLCEKYTLANDTVITLTDDYDNYDILVFVCEVPATNPYMENKFFFTNTVEVGKTISSYDDGAYERFLVTSKRTFERYDATSGTNGRVLWMYGIKL